MLALTLRTFWDRIRGLYDIGETRYRAHSGQLGNLADPMREVPKHAHVCSVAMYFYKTQEVNVVIQDGSARRHTGGV